MITLHDLDTAIARCQGEENPNAETCKKLAAFYTIKQYMYGKAPVKSTDAVLQYSYAQPPAKADGYYITTSGDSDFLMAVNGKSVDDLLPILDELMGVIGAISSRLYNGVLRKIEQL